ncbi:MAG: hypothetical protein H7831_08130 [Magnetococcus sp. WYHC-3]
MNTEERFEIVGVPSRKNCLEVEINGEKVLLGEHYAFVIEDNQQADENGNRRQLEFQDVIALENMGVSLVGQAFLEATKFAVARSEKLGVPGMFVIAINGPSKGRRKTWHIHVVVYLYSKAQLEEAGYAIPELVKPGWVINLNPPREQPPPRPLVGTKPAPDAGAKT